MMVIKGGKCKEERNRKKRKHEQVTTSNMVLKGLLRPARYFHGSIMTNRCFNPNKPRRRPCLICASFHHVTKKHHCSMNKDCSDKTTSSVCLRCGGLGHDMGLCKYEYTEDDLKSVQCYVCKRFGHLCCGEACDSPSSLWAVSCYRCGQMGHTGLSCGRHLEGSPEKESGFATSAANQDDLKKEKKKQRLDGEGVADSTPHESNRTMMTNKKKKRKKKKNNRNSEQHVTAHESNREKNDGILEQRSTLHESNGKTKKNKVEPEPSFTTNESSRKRKKNKKVKGEHPSVAEKPNLRSGLITENPFHRGKTRRLSSPTAASGQDHHILPVSPPGHNHRLHAAHMGHDYGSPRFISGGHYYPGSHSTTPYDRNRTNSSFEYNGHLSDPPPSRLWEHNYPPTSPIAPLGHSHHRLPFTPPGHYHRSPTFSSGGPYTGSLSTLPSSGNRRYSSFESNRHPLDLPSSRLRERYYPPTSPIAPSGHSHHRSPVTPQGHNHRLPTFSSGEHHSNSLSTIPPHGENHRDSFFEYNGRHLDPPFSRWHSHYHPTSPIAPPGHNHHMLPSTYMDRNHMLHSTYEGHSQRSPTFNSGGHYSSPLSSTRYGEYHRNSPSESNGYLSGPSTSRWHTYYPPTSSQHHHQEQNIYGHAPSRYGPPHRYGEFSGNYERW